MDARKMNECAWVHSLADQLAWKCVSGDWGGLYAMYAGMPPRMLGMFLLTFIAGTCVAYTPRLKEALLDCRDLLWLWLDIAECVDT